jgi:dTDP-4-amino-4,6-dideoxygalactose transaminase
VGGLKLGPNEKRYLSQVIKSNRLSYGPITKQFEHEFAALHGCRFALFCSSGTAALQLAISALKERYAWQSGDEVLVPAVTFIATSNVVIHSGLTPVFVDVDAGTFNIDPQRIEEHITPRTRAIMPVHLMGLPCEMAPIMEIADRYGLRIVEDACETMFARYRGQVVGSFGDVGCFSTYVAHFIVAGIGGFATTNDAELAVMMRSLMNHGRDSIYISIDDDDDVQGKQLEMIAEKRFSFVYLGHNFRATELEAAIGLGQLEDRHQIIEQRRLIAKRLLDGLSDLSKYLQLPVVPTDREHVFMLFPLVVRQGEKRSLVNYLENRGIETRDLMPLLNQPIYTKLFGDLESHYPVAASLNQSGFYIGCHQYMSDRDVDYIIKVFHTFFKQRSPKTRSHK